MREKEIEKKLTQMVKQAGGICPKLVSPGFDGMPDRMVLLPNGRIGFVEVKTPGEKPRPLQLSRHRLLRRLVHECCNYDGGHCIALDDGEECVCVQSISSNFPIVSSVANSVLI